MHLVRAGRELDAAIATEPQSPQSLRKREQQSVDRNYEILRVRARDADQSPTAIAPVHWLAYRRRTPHNEPSPEIWPDTLPGPHLSKSLLVARRLSCLTQFRCSRRLTLLSRPN